MNLLRHARYNAQEAIALAQQRAKQFDLQAASDRKTIESLQAAKDLKAFVIQKDSSPPEPSAPLMDRKSFPFAPLSAFITMYSGFRRAQLSKPHLV
jgi:DNA helicase INO80